MVYGYKFDPEVIAVEEVCHTNLVLGEGSSISNTMSRSLKKLRNQISSWKNEFREGFPVKIPLNRWDRRCGASIQLQKQKKRRRTKESNS